MTRKPVIKIAFADWWRGFSAIDFVKRFPFLLTDYCLEVSDEPDVVFHSVFANGASQRGFSGRPLRVLYTGENVAVDMNDWDYAFSFSRRTDHPRHFRLPNFAVTQVANGYSRDALLLANRRQDPTPRKRACAFLQSNCVPFREDFVRELMRSIDVDCGGRSLNNLGRRVGCKYRFYADYKFVVAFENERADGYVTEKVNDALLAGCVPIYWGDPCVGEDFSAERMVIYGDGASPQEVIARVHELDRNQDAYAELQCREVYPGDTLPEYLREDTQREWFRRIFASAVQGERFVPAEQHDAPDRRWGSRFANLRAAWLSGGRR